jgi:hypothetical protein
MKSAAVPTIFIIDDDRGMRQAIHDLVESVGLRAEILCNWSGVSWHETLKELIARYGSRGASEVARVYAFRNQRDEAFEWLDRAYARREGNVAYTNLDPMLKNLRSDPRYPAFLKKRNLPN